MNAEIRELSYAEALREAMAIAMEADERVFLMGEDIGVYGGALQVTGDLIERFGKDRVMDTPISELGGAGVAVGAAVGGMRPIYEFQFSDFAMLAMEQIANQAAKMRFMLGGAVSVPVVMRFPAGSGTGAAAQHSQSIEAWFAHVPGLKVIQPATPYDAKGMLLAAVEGLCVLGERDEAAELYPLVLEAIDSGALIVRFDCRLSQTVAGMAAAAARQWEGAEEHYRTALRQARELPHKIEQPEVRRWYARMLVDRDGPGDRDRALQLLAEAFPMYREIGMPKHVEMAEALLHEVS